MGQPWARGLLRLSRAARADLVWWRTFVQGWNGTSFLPSPVAAPQSLSQCWSDATLRAGAGFCSGQWFTFDFGEAHAGWSIAEKELYALTTTVTTFAPLLRRRSLLMFCDNESAVAAIQSGFSNHPRMMALTRSFLFVCARLDLSVSAQHLAGLDNTTADALSRKDWQPKTRNMAAAQRASYSLRCAGCITEAYK